MLQDLYSSKTVAEGLVQSLFSPSNQDQSKTFQSDLEWEEQ